MVLKRVFSVLLLVMFLFNWFGYRLLISFMENETDMQLEEQLDEEKYDPMTLVTIKVPVMYLPYYNNSETFERIDGQIEIQGIPYKYVKRRIFHDSLELLCIPNSAALQLQTAKNEFFKFTNDLKQEKKPGPRSGSVKVFSIDYYPTENSYGLRAPDDMTSCMSSRYAGIVLSPYSLTAEHPPEYSCCL
ncbi:MAG: hypothetical protein P4L51_20300 [Puia sp.]|nr:hypothetical protein [Puia sp.]